MVQQRTYQSYQGTVYVHEVAELNEILRAELHPMWYTGDRYKYGYSEDELLQLWYEYAIDSFQLVNVAGFRDVGLDPVIYNTFIHMDEPKTQLWLLLNIHPELSGRDVLVRCIRNTLYVVFYNTAIRE